MEILGSTPENLTDDCLNYTSKLLFIGIISTTASLISLLANLSVILLIVVYRKYVVMPQKVVLSVNLAAAFYSITIAIGSGVGYFTTAKRTSALFQSYCMWSGFFNHLAAWILLGAIWLVLADSYLHAVHGTNTHKYKWYYVAVVLVFPLLTSWIPFINSSYGDVGPWCWIRSINDTDCSPHVFGIVLQFATWYIPLLVSLLTMMALYIYILRQIRIKSIFIRYLHERHLHQVLKKEIRFLLIFPLVLLVINIVSAASSISGAVESNMTSLVPLWTVSAVLTPLQGGILAIMLGFDWDTVKRLVYHKPCLCCRNNRISEYPAIIYKRLSVSYSSTMADVIKSTSRCKHHDNLVQ